MAPKIDAHSGLEVLDRDACLGLLRRNSLGRIGVVAGGRPLIFPVNFALDGEAIVFRSDDGTKLHATRNGLVAFECDGIDRVYHTGWSVLATGKADVVGNVAELARLARLPLGPWCPGPKATWIRIRPTMISGRRIPSSGQTRTEGS